MEVRNEVNPSPTPASTKTTRSAPASGDSAAVSQRLQKELMSLMLPRQHPTQPTLHPSTAVYKQLPPTQLITSDTSTLSLLHISLHGLQMSVTRSCNADVTPRFLHKPAGWHTHDLRTATSAYTPQMSGNLGVSAFPESENIFNWVGTIEGGKGTPYEGLSYKLSLRFPLEYPFKPPQVKFETSCFHPNVDQYGNICLDILQDMWSSANDCRTVLLSIQSLLGEPNNESPLNSYAATLWRNQEEYRRMVQKQYMEGAEPLEK